MLIATFFFSLMNVGVKYLSHIPAVEIVFFRSVVSLVLSFSFLKLKQIPIWGNNKKLLIARGMAGAISLVLYFTTLQAIPLAGAVTIQFLSPIFTAILGIFIVNEKVAKRQWLFFLISFAGVVIIQGVDNRITSFYFFIGILAALFSGIAFNIIRKLNVSENPVVIVFYFPLVTIPVTGLYILTNWVNPTGIDLLIIILVGITTQIAQVYMTKAFQHEELSKIASLRYIGIIYALIFGHFLFGEYFEYYSYVGLVLVLLGVMLNIWYKQRHISGPVEKKNKITETTIQ